MTSTTGIISTEDAVKINAESGGSRFIQYGGLSVMVPVHDIRIAIHAVRNAGGREIMASVNAALARNLPHVRAGTASQRQAMQFGQDVAIWFAGEIVAGRAALELS